MAKFIAGLGIPMVGRHAGRDLDRHFHGSWEDFEAAIQSGFDFTTPVSYTHLFSWLRRLIKMKGLLLKDFYMARKYCRAYVVIAVVFSLLAVWGNTSFLLAYPVLLASVIPVNLISYDEKSKWSSFSGVFPYSKQQLVSVKYLMALIFLAFALSLIHI